MFESLEVRPAQASATSIPMSGWTTSVLGQVRRARDSRIAAYAATPFLVLSGVVLVGSAITAMGAAVVADRIAGKDRR